MEIDYTKKTLDTVKEFDPAKPAATAAALEALWLLAPAKEVVGLTSDDRESLNAVGVAVSVLTEIGKTVGKVARKQVDDFIPLMRCLWDDHGREGRIVAVHALGPMELAAPSIMVPVIYELARTCLAWEDCDQLSMRALEPIVRKQPEEWLPVIEDWLDDENKWVRRAGITVVARLPMKFSDLTERCLILSERMLLDEDRDVRRAVSFAIRLAARSDISPVRDFLARNVPPKDQRAAWVLSDVIRSMTKKFLPEFAPLIPLYEQWLASSDLDSKDRRSVESAVRILRDSIKA
ncbi:MAG: DNA alkylation repair protein [Anaerolineales bacterium]|nr:DNA alkylation repair protein [Anaerolineales bacterium]